MQNIIKIELESNKEEDGSSLNDTICRFHFVIKSYFRKTRKYTYRLLYGR